MPPCGSTDFIPALQGWMVLFELFICLNSRFNCRLTTIFINFLKSNYIVQKFSDIAQCEHEVQYKV